MAEDKKYLEEQFINFVIMLSQSVMLHLGKIANPLSGKIEKNLDGAKATIDLLVMFKEKTRGNLTDREDKFLATTLSNLQMNYVDELKQSPTDKEEKRSPEQSEGKEEEKSSEKKEEKAEEKKGSSGSSEKSKR